MKPLNIRRQVHVTILVDTDLVALFRAFDEHDVRAYFALFAGCRVADTAPDWWMEAHGYDYDADVPIWQRPMIYLADLRLDVEVVSEASRAVDRHVHVGLHNPTHDGPELSAAVRAVESKWTEDDYRALCLAVPWLGLSEDSTVERAELDRVPGPLDDPLV